MDVRGDWNRQPVQHYSVRNAHIGCNRILASLAEAAPSGSVSVGGRTQMEGQVHDQPAQQHSHDRQRRHDRKQDGPPRSSQRSGESSKHPKTSCGDGQGRRESVRELEVGHVAMSFSYVKPRPGGRPGYDGCGSQ